MAADPRQWQFISDVNHSGSTTIADAWLWLKWLFFYPGDGLFYLLIYKFPSVAKFFNIYTDNYGGAASFIMSCILWVAAIYIFAACKEAIFGKKNTFSLAKKKRSK